MTDLIKFDTREERPNIIKVIGVGGGGSNAVTHMFTEGIQGVDFILCNTDYQALEKSPVAKKVHLGKRALGAGNKPEVGRDAAIETSDELRELLSEDTKMLFITAGMGGGTGTGAAPVVAAVARELDILTVGIVTMPFSCEGKRRQQQALEGIAELRKHVDTLLVISNDKLRDEYGDMKLTQAFKKADDVLKTAAKGIAEIITVTGYVNVDFQDVNTVMRDSGKAIMGSGYAEGEVTFEMALDSSSNSNIQLVYQMVQQQLKEAGINVTLSTYDESSWLDLRKSGAMDSFIATWTMDYNDPANIMYTFFGSPEKTAIRSLNYADEAIMARVASASTIVDDDERMAEYQALEEKIVNEDAAWVPMFGNMHLFALGERVADFVPYWAGYSNFYAKDVTLK